MTLQAVRDRVRYGFAAALLVVATHATAQGDVVKVEVATFVVAPGGEPVAAVEAEPGAVVEYRLTVRNISGETLPPNIVVLSIPVAVGTTFVGQSVTVVPTRHQGWVEYSSDGVVFLPAAGSDPKIIRWTALEDLAPGAVVEIRYRVRVNEGFASRASSSRPSATFASDLDAFVQAMFGHLGIILVDCPNLFTGTYFCGEASTDFALFMQGWDLYSGRRDRVPVVPEPVTAWRRLDNSYGRTYTLSGTLFLVTFDTQRHVIIGR